ncbi:MAG TPA: amidohydrolase family protein [Pseudonocardiaceae bacterium]|nr:amidohydrolase family protein [Pseudonocardiaceae bacterium]
MRSNELIVDAHQHVGEIGDALSFDGSEPPPAPAIEDDAATRIQAMDKLGIEWAVLQPSPGYCRADGAAATRRLNDRMARYRDIAADRFRVLGTTEPLHGEVGLEEIHRARELGLDGFAWHHRFQGCYIDSRWMWPTLRMMSELGLVALVHVNAESSLEAHWRLQRLALEFPEVSFLAMDGFWTYERARHILMTAATTPNVVWDLGGPVCHVSIQEWVERNGSETISFSIGGYSRTGTPVMPPLFDKIERAAISDSDRANILGGNVARAFGAAQQ